MTPEPEFFPGQTRSYKISNLKSEYPPVISRYILLSSSNYQLKSSSSYQLSKILFFGTLLAMGGGKPGYRFLCLKLKYQ